MTLASILRMLFTTCSRYGLDAGLCVEYVKPIFRVSHGPFDKALLDLLPLLWDVTVKVAKATGGREMWFHLPGVPKPGAPRMFYWVTR